MTRPVCRALLPLLLAAGAAYASPFTVRVGDEWTAPADPVRVALFEACASYDCGVAWLDENASESAPVAVVGGPSEGGGVLRGALPGGRDPRTGAWWVVVSGGGRMPMALLWRPDVMPGHLPAPPAGEAATCRVVVTDEAGDPVAGARVAASVPMVATEERGRPSLFAAWRPWLPPVRTDARGETRLVVPSGEPTELYVGRPGRHAAGTGVLAVDGAPATSSSAPTGETRQVVRRYQSRTVACTPGSTVAVRLTATFAVTAELRDEAGRALAGALVRDATGVPLALADEAGQVELDGQLLRPETGASMSAVRLWVETSDGALLSASTRVLRRMHAASDERGELSLAAAEDAVRRAAARGEGVAGRPAVLIATNHSGLHSGRLRFEKGAAPADPVRLWREPRWPWRFADARAAPPLMQADRQEYSLRAIPGDGLWFAARGVGHAFCTVETSDLRPGQRQGSLNLRSDKRVECPPILRRTEDVRGVVVDEAGAPVADADVWLTSGVGHEPHEPTIIPEDRHLPGVRVLLRTDGAGRFVGQGLTRPTRPIFGTASPSLLQSLFVTVRHEDYLPLERQPAADATVGGAGGHRSGASDEAEIVVVLKRGVAVTGRLVDAATGEPVVGAQVALGRFRRGPGQQLLGRLDGLNAAGGRFGALRVTHAEASGKFRLTAAPGTHDLAVQAPRRAFLVRRSLNVPAEGADLGTIHLEPDLAILGEVLDREGQAVAGASILAAGSIPGETDQAPQTDLYAVSGVAANHRSDARGQFRVGGLGEGSLVDLEISAPGLGTRRLAGVGPTAGDRLRVVLPPEAVLEGRVTHRGEPVSTWLRLERAGQSDPSGWLGRPTMKDGSFRIGGLEEGRHYLTADGVGEVEGAVTSVELRAGDVTRVALDLGGAPGSLAGAVTLNGAGVPGVTVEARRRRTVTDASGRYVLDRLPRGSATVVATRTEGNPLTLAETVEVGSGAGQLNFDFSVFEVGGQVVLGEGHPVGGVALLFLRDGGGLATGTRVVARGDGSFSVGLAAGAWRVVAPHDLGGELAEPLLVRGPRSDVRIVLPVGLRIDGLVRGLSDGELSSLWVEARNDDLESRPGRVDAQGRFTIEGLAPGSWLVVARAGGAGPSGAGRRAERRVRLAGEDARVELEFERLAAVEGTVRLDGVPLASAPVLLMQGRELAGGRRVWTRHDGSFRFDDLQPGDYTLGVGAKTVELTVRGADRNLAFDFGAGRVEGRVVERSTAAPLAGATVHLWPRAARRPEAEALGLARRSFTDGEGHFAFDRTPEGEWVVEVEGLPGARVRVDVVPGGTVVVTLP